LLFLVYLSQSSVVYLFFHRIFISFCIQIVFKRQGAFGSIEVDDSGLPEFGTSPGGDQLLSTRGNVYIGGVPNPNMMTQGLYSDGFVGCIHSLRIQQVGPINLYDNALSAVNTGPCVK